MSSIGFVTYNTRSHNTWQCGGTKLAIVSAVSGDFLNVSVAPISGEKWGGSARSIRALFRPKYGKIQGRIFYLNFQFGCFSNLTTIQRKYLV